MNTPEYATVYKHRDQTPAKIMSKKVLFVNLHNMCVAITNTFDHFKQMFVFNNITKGQLYDQTNNNC